LNLEKLMYRRVPLWLVSCVVPDTGGRRLELGRSRYIDPKTQGPAILVAANARCG